MALVYKWGNGLLFDTWLLGVCFRSICVEISSKNLLMGIPEDRKSFSIA
jgi:hypothetical protein